MNWGRRFCCDPWEIVLMPVYAQCEVWASFLICGYPEGKVNDGTTVYLFATARKG
jgi:hypothetical protein